MRERRRAGAGSGAYIDVYDLADALRLAAEAATARATRSSASRRPTSRRYESLEGARRAASTATPPPPRPPDAARPGGLSIAKARRLLGYDPTPVLARLPRRDGGYSVALNSQIAMPSIDEAEGEHDRDLEQRRHVPAPPRDTGGERGARGVADVEVVEDELAHGVDRVGQRVEAVEDRAARRAGRRPGRGRRR